MASSGKAKTWLQIVKESIDKLAKEAGVKPIEVKKGMNLKGVRIPFDDDELGLQLGSRELYENIKNDPLSYDRNVLDSLSDEFTINAQSYDGKLPFQIESHRNRYQPIDVGFGEMIAKGLVNGEEYASGYKVLNAYPDGSVSMKVVKNDEEGNPSYSKSFYEGPSYDRKGRFHATPISIARPGSTGQWATIGDRHPYYNVDFNSKVPVKYVRAKRYDYTGARGPNYTDFNPNLKKYRDGFPVSEAVDIEPVRERIANSKRIIRGRFSDVKDPLTFNDDFGETSLMSGLKWKADEIRADKASVEIQKRLDELKAEEQKIYEQIQALRDRKDSINNVYWDVKDKRDSIAKAVRRYNR